MTTAMNTIATHKATTLHVSLARAARHAPGPLVPHAALLDERGARVMLWPLATAQS